jgi:Tfp pilus assembly protein PilW
MHKTAPTRDTGTHAFTVVELMVATVVAGFALVATAAFTFAGLKTYYRDANRLQVNYDMRKLTQLMASDAAYANAFYIYDPATAAIPTSGTDNYVTPGNPGDDLLLVTYTSDTTTGVTTVTKLIAYYRPATDATLNNIAPLYRIEVDNLSVAQDTAIYTLWNSNILPIINAGTAKIILQSVIGAATPVGIHHAETFYNLYGSSLMVLAKVQEEQGNQGLTMAIDTYNFTVWPRG